MGEAKRRRAAPGKIQGYFINRELFAKLLEQALVPGKQDSLAAKIAGSIGDFLRRPPAEAGSGALCGACEYEFVGAEKPAAFYFLMTQNDQQAVMTGLCHRCAALPTEHLLEAMRPFLSNICSGGAELIHMSFDKRRATQEAVAAAKEIGQLKAFAPAQQEILAQSMIEQTQRAFQEQGEAAFDCPREPCGPPRRRTRDHRPRSLWLGRR
jgi:hypothetical protein